MYFYNISLPDKNTTNSLLEKACKKRNVSYTPIYPNINLKIGGARGDIFYRVANGTHKGVLNIEDRLLLKGLTSFYQDNKSIENRIFDHDSYELDKIITSLPRQHYLTKGEIRVDWESIVEELGGFPIILKIVGGSHGIGVIQVDSLLGLRSLSDYLRTQKINFVLKEFIKVKSSVRLIVLGNEVIDAIEYIVPSGDFRSNLGSAPIVKKYNPDLLTKQQGVMAVQGLGLEFGGVDVLMSERGPLVAEVNFPCYFPRCQLLTGTDISGMMIDFLIEKSKKIGG